MKHYLVVFIDNWRGFRGERWHTVTDKRALYSMYKRPRFEIIEIRG